MKVLKLALLSCLSLTPLMAADLYQVNRILHDGELAFYRLNDRRAALAYFDAAEQEIAGLPESPLKDAALARVNLARGEIHEINGNRNEAEPAFSRAFERASAAYAEDPTDSEVCRIAADAGMRILPYRSMLFKARHGFEPRDRANRAFQIDPSNGNALMSLGLYYYFCPPLFGGSFEKAATHFRAFIDAESESIARFKGFMWLALAFRETGRTAEAESAFAEAARLIPGNEWLITERRNGMNEKERGK